MHKTQNAAPFKAYAPSYYEKSYWKLAFSFQPNRCFSLPPLPPSSRNALMGNNSLPVEMKNHCTDHCPPKNNQCIGRTPSLQILILPKQSILKKNFLKTRKKEHVRGQREMPPPPQITSVRHAHTHHRWPVSCTRKRMGTFSVDLTFFTLSSPEIFDCIAKKGYFERKRAAIFYWCPFKTGFPTVRLIPLRYVFPWFLLRFARIVILRRQRRSPKGIPHGAFGFSQLRPLFVIRHHRTFHFLLRGLSCRDGEGRESLHITLPKISLRFCIDFSMHVCNEYATRIADLNSVCTPNHTT